MAYDAETQFKKELKENGCWCCNAYCWANFMLTIGLIFNILAIIFLSFAVAVMYNPVGTFIGKCMAEDGEVENCDFKLVLEDNGFTKEVSIAFLVAQCFGFIVNLMGYIGLHKWYLTVFCIFLMYSLWTGYPDSTFIYNPFFIFSVFPIFRFLYLHVSGLYTVDSLYLSVSPPHCIVIHVCCSCWCLFW